MTADRYIIPIISFRTALLLAAFFTLSSIAFSILLSGELRIAANDLLCILVDMLAVLALFSAAQRSAICRREVQLAWAVLALAMISHAIGDIIWTFYELILHQSPFPSLADVPYLMQYPLFIIGILLLPSISLTSSERLKVMLDEGIVVIASVMLFWALLIAPTIEYNAGAGITHSNSLCSLYGYGSNAVFCSDRAAVPEGQIPADGPTNAFGYGNGYVYWNGYPLYEPIFAGYL